MLEGEGEAPSSSELIGSAHPSDTLIAVRGGVRGVGAGAGGSSTSGERRGDECVFLFGTSVIGGSRGVVMFEVDAGLQ